MVVQIDTKTVYSFLDSLIDIDNYVKRSKESGYQAIAIMDLNNMYGAYRFIQETKKQGIKGIVGVELNLEYREDSTNQIRLMLLAKDTVGYQHVMACSTKKMTGVKKLSEYISYFDEHIDVILPYQEGIESLEFPFDYLIGLYKDSPNISYSKETVALHTSRVFAEEDIEALQVERAIKENVSLNASSKVKNNQFLITPSDLENEFQDFPNAINNLNRFLNYKDYQLDSELKLPRFNRSRPAVEELTELVFRGLKEKGLESEAYINRANYELSVIHDMGFDDYFLIVWDLLKFGREKGYYMGMGRGSAAGSLVSFSLNITGIDPVKNNLLFERFLNNERYTMPDIDIDLPDISRREFLHYIKNRYGSTHTAQIVTFQTFGAKQAIRDVFKRFGANEYELKNITNKVSSKDTLSSAYDNNISFRQLINSKPEYQRAFEIAKKIEGKPRNSSTHAAGVVMSDDELTLHVPLKSGEEMLLTQYDGPTVEANGLLKMDFLGLRNLKFVQMMKERLDAETHQDFDIASIDLNDKKTLELFSRGDTKGVFQFEASGAIQLLKRIKPEKFDDVVATTSLNRPGASDYSENFIRRRFKKEAVNLIDPSIAHILEPTYGIMLYQEQVMQIAQIFSGFSLGKADLLRRAMSKKNATEMHLLKSDFMAGASELGRNPNIAEQLFEMMEKFAGYGFNRSHAYAYAALSFQLAYFKVHHTRIFYDVMLNESSSEYIVDALASHFALEKLTINRVPYHDKISDYTITLGLKTIKAIPRDFALWIIENRPYKSVEDFFIRLPIQYQKKSIIEPLIQIGLFDEFEKNRQKLMVNVEPLFSFVNELGSLFGDTAYNWSNSTDYTEIEKFEQERHWLGVGISSHPLKTVMKTFEKPYQKISDLAVVNETANLLIVLESMRVIRTKTRGEQMAFLTVSDTENQLSVTIFPEQFKYYANLLEDNGIYYISGKLQERDEEVQLILQKLEKVELEKFWIKLENHNNDQEIAKILAKYPGSIPVILHYIDKHETIQSNRFKISKNNEIEHELSKYVVKTVFH